MADPQTPRTETRLARFGVLVSTIAAALVFGGGCANQNQLTGRFPSPPQNERTHTESTLRDGHSNRIVANDDYHNKLYDDRGPILPAGYRLPDRNIRDSNPITTVPARPAGSLQSGVTPRSRLTGVESRPTIAPAGHTVRPNGSDIAMLPQPHGSSEVRHANTVGHSRKRIQTATAWQLNEPPPKPADNSVPIPLRKIPGAEKVELQATKDRITLRAREAPLNAVLAVIAQHQGLNIVVASDANDAISVTLHDVPMKDAIDSLMAISGCTWTTQSGIIFVSKIKANSTTDATVQGRKISVIPLSFVSATDMEKAIKPLLSPVGKIFTLQSDPQDKRRTREQIVIEEIEPNLARIAKYVSQLDQPPRQVQIEAHVLQVTLNDEIRHGVNFNYLQQIAGKELSLATVGFADPLATPAAFFSLTGGKLETLIEVLKRTTDAKTLATPKVMVVNGQRAKIQIGERLGYLVTTTTQTSTLQNVNFLDVGVVLEVTPQITADGQILMLVKPKVSGGQVTDGLPQEQTTEVESTVMVPDGQGIVIGGLIQEFDDDRQIKVPLLGDLWLIGRAFQFRFGRKERKELIIALVPRIVPYGAPRNEKQEAEWQQASTRLFQGPLLRNDRPWEAQLPDAVRDPRRPRLDRFPRAFRNLRESHPLPADYYFPPASRNPRVPRTKIELDEPPVEELKFEENPAAGN